MQGGGGGWGYSLEGKAGSLIILTVRENISSLNHGWVEKYTVVMEFSVFKRCC